MDQLNTRFADRVSGMPESFIREILKVASMPDIISFAGGLPNPRFFPLEKIAAAAEQVLRKDGASALQYAGTEGYLPLRDYLAQRQSSKEGIPITPEQVIILSGSQQGLDLAGKLFCNKGEPVLLEAPSYLGAIQAFSAYEPRLHSVRLLEDGPDLHEFKYLTRKVKPGFFYCVPNFQNPTGTNYSDARRIELIESQSSSGMLWIEDNPYGDIRFEKEAPPDFHSLIPGKTIHLGSFSKIVSPGLRLGWATAPVEIIKKMAISKQASDLHSNNLSQRIVFQFLNDNSLDDHLDAIRSFYHRQANLMTVLVEKYFPPDVKFVKPRGGMFLWITLPETMDAGSILNEAVERKVVFVPGSHFFSDPGKGKNTMRLNFSNPSEEDMERGIRIIGKILHDQPR